MLPEDSCCFSGTKKGTHSMVDINPHTSLITLNTNGLPTPTRTACQWVKIRRSSLLCVGTCFRYKDRLKPRGWRTVTLRTAVRGKWSHHGTSDKAPSINSPGQWSLLRLPCADSQGSCGGQRQDSPEPARQPHTRWGKGPAGTLAGR